MCAAHLRVWPLPEEEGTLHEAQGARRVQRNVDARSRPPAATAAHLWPDEHMADATSLER